MWKVGILFGLIFVALGIFALVCLIFGVDAFTGNPTPYENLTESENFLRFFTEGILATFIIILSFLIGGGLVFVSVYFKCKQ